MKDSVLLKMLKNWDYHFIWHLHDKMWCYWWR